MLGQHLRVTLTGRCHEFAPDLDEAIQRRYPLWSGIMKGTIEE